MSPEIDIRRMSLLSECAYSVPRSQSDISHGGLARSILDNRGRRQSEWSSKDRSKMVLRPLQLNDKNTSGLLYRRLSRTYRTDSSPRRSPVQESPTRDMGKVVTSQPSPTRDQLCRSHSIKYARKAAEARQRHRGSSIPSEVYHHGVKVKERTISNRSLPLPGDESDYLRLRNFSVTSKGVINRGDSFRCKTDESKEPEMPPVLPVVPPTPESEQKELPCRKPYKILLVGASGVGKTAMTKQFMTSEYICSGDIPSDHASEQSITVVLNNEESQMEFEKETLHDDNKYAVRDCWDACVVVYSVTDRHSYAHARHYLSRLGDRTDSRAVILVGNKTDLARLRALSTEEGKSLAKERGCKFIETSVGINHNIDELLVGALSQIRIKQKVAEKLRKKRDSNWRTSLYSGSKASGVLKKILRKACLRSKSCDNLHVL